MHEPLQATAKWEGREVHEFCVSQNREASQLGSVENSYCYPLGFTKLDVCALQTQSGQVNRRCLLD